MDFCLHNEMYLCKNEYFFCVFISDFNKNLYLCISINIKFLSMT